MTGNKYNLRYADMKRLRPVNAKAVAYAPFWRNNVINAWCLSASTETSETAGFRTSSEYWLAFYDEDAPEHPGETGFYMRRRGFKNYRPKRFLDAKYIQSSDDLKIQRELIETVNQLIDDGRLYLPEKKGFFKL